MNLARIVLPSLGLIGKGNECARRPTEEELKAFYGYFDSNPRQIIPKSCIDKFAIASAMRREEIWCVTWDDLDLQKKLLLMRTLAIDHSVVTNEAWWPVLAAAVGSGETRLQLSVWNLVEIGFAEDIAQQRRRLDFLTGLKPWWALERLQIQKQEMERFLWAEYYGVDPKPLTATTEFLSVVDSYFAGALTRVGLTPYRFIAETDFKLLQAAKKHTPTALRTLQSAGKAKLRQVEKAMFEAWIKPNIPDTDASGRLLKVAEKEALLQFCYEQKDAFLEPAVPLQQKMLCRWRAPAIPGVIQQSQTEQTFSTP